MEKYLLKNKEEFSENMKSYWKSRTYNQYLFENESSPLEYPCVAVITSYSVPDTYLTEYTINFVYLKDFNNT